MKFKKHGKCGKDPLWKQQNTTGGQTAQGEAGGQGANGEADAATPTSLAGNGTTCLAAQRLGRLDVSKEYCKLACRRLACACIRPERTAG